jgi:hypothetical protein
MTFRTPISLLEIYVATTCDIGVEDTCLGFLVSCVPGALPHPMHKMEFALCPSWDA